MLFGDYSLQMVTDGREGRRDSQNIALVLWDTFNLEGIAFVTVSLSLLMFVFSFAVFDLGVWGRIVVGRVGYILLLQFWPCVSASH